MLSYNPFFFTAKYSDPITCNTGKIVDVIVTSYECNHRSYAFKLDSNCIEKNETRKGCYCPADFVNSYCKDSITQFMKLK